MTEVVVAVIAAIGLVVPTYFAAFTGESREIKNLSARIELVRTMPKELGLAKAHLIREITNETAGTPKSPPLWLALVVGSAGVGAVFVARDPDAFFPNANPTTVRAWAFVVVGVMYAALLVMPLAIRREIKSIRAETTRLERESQVLKERGEKLKKEGDRLKKEIEGKKAAIAERERLIHVADAIKETREAMEEGRPIHPIDPD